MQNQQPITESATKFVAQKGRLFKIYQKLSEEYKKNVLTNIIIETRNLTYDRAKWVKTITPKEFRMFQEEVGFI